MQGEPIPNDSAEASRGNMRIHQNELGIAAEGGG